MNYHELEQWMKDNNYEMLESLSEPHYYYCVRNNEDKTQELIWSDSACEDAYDIETASFIAYDFIKDKSSKRNVSDFTEILADSKRGGRREGAGRKETGRNRQVLVRISKEAEDILKTKPNKSEYIDMIIKKCR